MSSPFFVAWPWPELDHIFQELAAVTLLVILVRKQIWTWRSEPVKKAKVSASPDAKFEDPIVCKHSKHMPKHPDVQMCAVPYSGVVVSSGTEFCFENDICTGRSLAFHRNTWDRIPGRQGDYFGYDFPSPAVNWEKRVQLRLKEPPKGTLMFGIELDDYVPVNDATRIAMKLIVGAMKLVVGNDLYHSVGDDPAVTDGEAERPIFSMPMWAFDQFIETPRGEEPPSLFDPNFRRLGITRKDSTKEFTQKMLNTKWEPGPTYTFSFWSISRFLDLVLWKISGAFPGVSMDMDQFCGRPPVHIVIYDFVPSVANNRHIDSAKRYLFHTALWSSEHPPPPARLQQLVPAGKELQDNSLEESKDAKKFRGCYCCF